LKVDVRYFAAAREAAGRDVESLALEDGATVASLRALLLVRHARLRALGEGLRVAVDEHFATDDLALSEGDVVALIPPVSGG